MIINNLKSEIRGVRKRISANVQWEDCNRPTYELYFETDVAFADGFICNPHAFLVGCIIPAFHFGEQRVYIDKEICPELREGLSSVMRFFRYWYYSPDKKLVKIEAKTKSDQMAPHANRRAGFFFSGGIDSFATICANRINYPSDHYRSIKDGFIVFGLEQDDPKLFEHVLASLKNFDGTDGFSMIPVYTNVYMHFRDEDAAAKFRFWLNEFGGAALASVAHSFSQRVSTVSIASSSHLYDLEPWGSHPLIDLNFSSHDMRIIHDGLSLTRLDKIKIVSNWDLALQHLRVCNKFKQYRKGMLNCGECEKCVRTMLGLLAVGALDKTEAFPVKDVTRERVLGNAKKVHDLELLKPMYEEIIPELRKKERNDLVSAIEMMINPPKDNLWKTKIIDIDKKYLGSRLVRFKKKLKKSDRLRS